MATQLATPGEEIKRLQRCINDLVSILALPAIWTGGGPAVILQTLLDALVQMLNLDLIYVRLNSPAEEAPRDLMRLAEAQSTTAATQNVKQMFDGLMDQEVTDWPSTIRDPIAGGTLSIMPFRLGIAGEMGIIVAGSRRADFPGQTEKLVLSVAANQAAIGLQEAHLRNEQKRLASELDRRVAQRTAELAAANEELNKEIVERKRADKALRASEINLRQIVDSLPGLVCTTTPAGEIDLLNRQVLDYFGRTSEELRSWAFGDAVHPDDLPRVIAARTLSIQNGTPYDIEHRCRRADGVYRWFQVRALPVRDTKGIITGWYVLLSDIDDRKRAEDAIRASERNLDQIINTIPALAWSARPDGSADFFNQHYLDYVGLTGEQAKDWGWTIAVHPEDVNSLATAWRLIMASGKSGESEARLRRFDGEYQWFLFRVNPLRDDSGNIIRWYGTNTDIDDRKRAEEELRRNEAFLAEGQRLSLTGTFSWCVATDQITWSEQVYRIFDFDPAMKVTLELIASRVYPDDMPLLFDMIERARGDGSDFEYDHRLLMPDNSVKYLHLVAHGTRDQHGQLEYIGAVQDVTERRRSDEALGAARSELAHMTRVTSLGALTASIAHEVNQPLSGIITNASTCLRMLAADPPNIDGARETAQRTIRDGHRASDVITRLRALFSKTDSKAEPVDLNEATREVIALSRRELQKSQVIPRLELVDDLPLVIGDRVQLQQVILNLLLNASDSMKIVDNRPRLVVIKTERGEDDHVRLAVKDAGIGFQSQDVNKIFEPFFSTKSSGMGIGLSISRSIIESHHGRIWATQNDDGVGATFYFSIPAEPKRMTASP